MHSAFKYIALVLVLAFAVTVTEAKDMKKEKIKTSAVCGMCKTTIETALSKVEGVESSDLHVKSKKVKVVYDSDVVSLEEIKQAIAKAGYNADEVERDKEAYENLHECCKDGAHD